MRAEISPKEMGLKSGDRLTYIDGVTHVTVMISMTKGVIWVQSDQPGDIQMTTLEAITLALQRKEVATDSDIYSEWMFKGKTLRAIYAERRAIPAKKKKVKPIPKSRWIKNLRADGNLFYLEHCIRFTANLCVHFNGTLKNTSAFAPVSQMIRREKMLAIFKACTTVRTRKDMEGGDYGLIMDPKRESCEDLLKALWQHPQSKPILRKELRPWLLFAKETLARWQVKQSDPVRSRFEELRRLFALSDTEFDLLVLAAAVGSNTVWNCVDFRGDISSEKITMFAAFMGLTEPEYLALIKTKSKLRRFGCLDEKGDINKDLIPFITGVDDTPILNRYFKKSDTEVLPWEYFGELSERHGAFLKRMISVSQQKRGMNILLYGRPGTGKTSFALALAAELGRTPYLITQADVVQKNKEKSSRFAALQVCDSQVDPAQSLIIIDEADEMLEGSASGFMEMLLGSSGASGSKGLLNDVLDTVKTPCVWISNSRERSIDSSNRRRFDYSIRFDTLTCKQREKIWQNAVQQHAIAETLDSLTLSRLAAKYEVSAGGISLAVTNLSAMLKGGTATLAEAERVAETILKPHCKLMGIEDDKSKTLVASDYSLEGLNIKGSLTLDRITHAIKRFLSEQHAEEQRKGADHPRMNLLLSGPPGTGKTEFVKYLGASLDTRVMTRMGSDLLNKYVGGTEQNIKQAFEQAAADKAILFLDEVDGLIQSRERASKSWEITQVNELLQQMENFEGVLICATNFANNLDPATLRRFTFKLEFDFLTDDGKRSFFKRMFPDLGADGLTPAEEERLYRIPLVTPGDFRTVRQGLYYLDDDMTIEQVLEGLERESEAKRMGRSTKAIGFR
jgi:SpoVK/Ycf46/Vps4 family AAA+-type ATPase